MALNIKNPEVDRLARRVAELRETGVTEAVRAALERDVVELEKARAARLKAVGALVREIQAEARAIPDRAPRSMKEHADWLWSDDE